MNFLLDTNAVSGLMKREPGVVEHTLRYPGRVTLAEPTAAEIEYGLSLLSKGRKRATLSDAWRTVERALPSLPWTRPVSEAFGAIKANLQRRGKSLGPRGDFDVALAAHAIVHGCVLVTRNAQDFRRIPSLRIENWHA